VDYRIRATAASGGLRALATLTTGSARIAQEAHRAGPLAAAAMGRTISAAVLLASDLKGDGRVSVELN
jgi:molecular chaperone Hsp33